MSKLKEMAASVAEKIGLSDMFKKAKSAADYDKVLAELDGQMRTVREESAALESKRSTIILEGGDVDAYQARVISVRERLNLLQSSRVEAQRRRDEAAASEATHALETRIAAVRAEHFQTYQRRLNDHALAMRAAVETGRAILAAEKSIADANYEVEHAGRPDLKMNTPQVRAEVKANLLDRSILPLEPVRMGSVDPDIARKLRSFPNELKAQQERARLMTKLGVSERALQDTESDFAFALRCQNYERLVADTIKREDPLKKLADEMYEIIDTVTTPRAPGDFRSNRRVNFTTFVRNGEVVERRFPVDGIGKPVPMNLAGQR